MTNHQQDSAGSEHHDDERGTVSEGGSGSLNSETALGGADSVPDTPDVNDSGEHGAHDVNVASDGVGADADAESGADPDGAPGASASADKE